MGITEEILGYKIELKELDETVEAGNQFKALLMSAQEAGTWDMFFSNPLTSLEKNSAIDRSREAIVWAQHCPRLFEIELKDVGAENSGVRHISLKSAISRHIFLGFSPIWSNICRA